MELERLVLSQAGSSGDLGTGVPAFAMTVEGRGEDESGRFEGSERRVEFEVLPE